MPAFFLRFRPSPCLTLFPYTTLFRSRPRSRTRRPAHDRSAPTKACVRRRRQRAARSEEHTSELQSPYDLVCRLLLEKKKFPVPLCLSFFNSISASRVRRAYF